MEYFCSLDVENRMKEQPSLKDELVGILREASLPLDPIPTGESPQGLNAPEVEAVLFDIYGTLVISQSGDVGSAKISGKEEIFREALEAAGISPLRDDQVKSVHDAYYEEITESHRLSKEEGIDFPEVDIISIWHRVLERTLVAEGFPINFSETLLGRLAVIYESRSNISCAMPGTMELLNKIVSRNIPLGIVSNAQFYTPLLLEALFGGDVDSLGFSSDLLIWSYREGRGKPSSRLFETALTGLAERGLSAPDKILYVGNDMRNDIFPPKQLKMQTALFAGDLRSLRKREKDPLYSYMKPDIILTELEQLTSLL